MTLKNGIKRKVQKLILQSFGYEFDPDGNELQKCYFYIWFSVFLKF